ncbi:MAG: hypothetical protein HRU20_21990 [Pseudomonadales bacterium]|nr:hypothetical protein [Pseudomonadales bacterium]
MYFEGIATADISAQTGELNAGFTAVEQSLAGQGITVNLDPVRDDVAFNEEDSKFMGLGIFMNFEYVFIGAESTIIDVDKTKI